MEIEYLLMSKDVQSGRAGLVRAVNVACETSLQQSPNGLRYATYGQNELAPGELERIVQAVPRSIAAALSRKAYYFVPLAMSADMEALDREPRSKDEAMVSPVYTPELGDEAICHRNVTLGPADGVFISTRLMNDRFALAFEFFLNVGHAFVEVEDVPERFRTLLWDQAVKAVHGETSQDAWESREQSMIRARVGGGPEAKPRMHIDEKARGEFLEAAFSDAVAIYLLSLSIDFNYAELREREYPLLAPRALAERLRLAAELFPPNPGYEFSIRYKRRT